MFRRIIEKAPHACFKAEFPSPSSAREEISRILESHLCARFGAVKRAEFWRWGVRFLDVKVEQKWVWVAWYTNRFMDGEWILCVAPDLPPLWDFIRGRQPVVYTEELMLISRDIHALLASVAGISNVWWYFRGFRRQRRRGVWTPDELPWAET